MQQAQLNTVRTVLITGCNRGLGLGTVSSLFKANPQKLDIVITCRNDKIGNETLDKLKQINPEQNIRYFPLDIENFDTHNVLVDSLKKENINIDILVNNVGINLHDDGTNLEERRKTIAINYQGTVNFTKQMILGNALTGDAKIIMISSQLGRSMHQPEYSTNLFNKEVSEEKLNEEVEYFLNEKGNVEQKYNKGAYFTSKFFLNGWIRWVSNSYLKSNQNLIAVCPGWCQTDLGGKNAKFTVEEGIQFTLDNINDGKYGRNENHKLFWQHGKQLEY